MSISFTCDHCGKPYHVSESLAGKKARCKQCGTDFLVPSPARKPSSAPPRPTSAPVKSGSDADRFGFDDLPAPKRLYEIEDEPVLPRRAPATWQPRERDSRPAYDGDQDPASSLNLKGMALFGGAIVLSFLSTFCFGSVEHGAPFEFNAPNIIGAACGFAVLGGFICMVVASLMAIVRLIGFGEFPRTGILGWITWVLSTLMVGGTVISLTIFGPEIYRRAVANRDVQGVRPGQPAFQPPAWAPAGAVPAQPQLGPPQVDVRVALHDGQVMRNTNLVGGNLPGVKIQVSYNLETGRAMGEKYVLMIKSRSSRAKLLTFHLQGSGTLSGANPTASIDDGPFEAWMELESFNGQNSRRVSETIPLQVVEAPTAQPPNNPAVNPNGAGQPPANRPGMAPGRMGPIGPRGPRGFSRGRP